jgi:hypothetical protein
MVDTIKHIFIVLIFQQNQCLYTTYILAWAHVLVRPPGNYPVYACIKTELTGNIIHVLGAFNTHLTELSLTE